MWNIPPDASAGDSLGFTEWVSARVQLDDKTEVSRQEEIRVVLSRHGFGDEMVQDVLVWCWLNLPDFPDKCAGLVVRVAGNLARNERRVEARQRDYESAWAIREATRRVAPSMEEVVLDWARTQEEVMLFEEILAGCTQQEMAERRGVSQQTMSRWIKSLYE